MEREERDDADRAGIREVPARIRDDVGNERINSGVIPMRIPIRAAWITPRIMPVPALP
jgi:hypothetical protein